MAEQDDQYKRHFILEGTAETEPFAPATARYALVVSIHAPVADVKLYSAIANQIPAPVAVAA